MLLGMNSFQGTSVAASSGGPGKRGEPRPPVARLEGVTKRFGNTRALNGVTLNVNPGEVLAILGPNGAGKTTAINCLLGLVRPDQGRASLFGGEPTRIAARVRTGAMLQISGVPETLKVREHLLCFATYYPAPLGITEVIRLAGLGEVADRLYGKLSGGQRQRVHFALALIGNPELLFLDEPTTGLDVASRRQVWNSVRDLVGGHRTVILTTHYLEEADALADRIVLLHEGHVLVEGTPAEIKRQVAGSRVQFVSNLPLKKIFDLPHVAHAEKTGTATVVLTPEPERTVLKLLQLDPQLRGLQVSDTGLEETFIALTTGRTEEEAT